MTDLGLLTIEFNKEYFLNLDKHEGRNLQDALVIPEINDYIDLSILNSDDNENQDKSIVAYHLKGATRTSLSIQVIFNDPIAISPDIREPDVFQISVLKDAIIDAETLESLDIELSTFTFEVVPQNTEEMKELIT